jgi:murein L,D-transpeptidase YcbB/YkuD
LNLGGRPAVAAVQPSHGSIEALVAAELEAVGDPDLAAFYRARGYRPLWIDALGPTPAAYMLAARLADVREDGLDPADYADHDLRRALLRAHAPADQAALELELSQAYGRYAVDLTQPPALAALAATDPDLSQRRLTPAQALAAAARSPSLVAHIQTLTPQNPVYRGLKAALIVHRGSRPPGARPDAYEQALILNLARARALPADAEARFVLVDAASARLWLIEDGRVAATMPVAVGTVKDPTPLMAGMIRYAAYHPYWYIPPDLARETYAPLALREGPATLTARGLEVLSDWTDQASPVDPATVDWQAVADGRQTARLRQLPGPENMMGQVKLMLPNGFGVYLHDTPDHGVFDRAARNFSHGCVRLSDARRLAAQLHAPPPANDPGAPEERVDLPRPTPVYIGYFTALPADGGRTIAFAPDVYGRDRPLLAQLDAGRRLGAVELAAR